MSHIPPLELSPGRRNSPSPLSLAPSKKRRGGTRRPWLAALAAAGLLAAWGMSHALPLQKPAAFLYPQTQFQGGTLELKLYGSGPARRLSCEFAGSSYPFYETAPGEFRALLPVKIFSRPVLHHAVVKRSGWLGTRVLTRVPVIIKKADFPHFKLTIRVKSPQSREDRAQMIAAARQAIWQALSIEDPRQHWAGNHIFPLHGRVSARYGERRTVNGKPGAVHYGLDIGAPRGTEVLASNDGVVALTGDFPLQGRLVLLNHGQGLSTVYMHMDEILAREGEKVRRGQPIGKSGSTGRSTGPHLHWSAYVHGTPVNPTEWLERVF